MYNLRIMICLDHVALSFILQGIGAGVDLLLLFCLKIILLSILLV